mmetsp:Transcript_14274/g.42584  ORF Transcript_14274/g.42584 Transcript_14274/m.42584 type:complete len:229 (+) Transcript_14274:214-900(+)|eukprot:CAMPEP_0119294208 /NCGR_PEP_ID=MMETSP1329-20130426/47518_1 /TAXON_ID=114041 /ORGANISM="Genus nov. species nov., Strain RCC1024" /LENGTH=228 /DNA_ID=CAMNT_0007295089 /DNA_START=119 /DNA_END=805 /DNA_ORIENTATION=-
MGACSSAQAPGAAGEARIAPPRCRVHIEGNIGVGKSTVLEHLREHYKDDGEVCVVPEPAEAWEHSGLLAGLYSGSLSGVGFQLVALVTRFAGLRAAETTASVVITERSVGSDRGVFAAMTLKDVDMRAYALAHDALLAGAAVVPSVTVLLRADVGKLAARIEARGRASEQPVAGGGVDASYLARLEAAHDAYFEALAEAAKFRVDAALPPREVADRVIAIVEQARGGK